MKIGILSDTHDQTGLMEKACKVLQQNSVERVYHLGDWCSPFMAGFAARFACPVLSVFGNNDADIFKHLKVKPANLEFKDRFYVDAVDGRNIALIHGDPEELAFIVAESGRFDAVIRGHTHVSDIRRIGKTLVINPGSLCGPFENRGWTPPSVAILNTADLSAEIVPV